MHWGHIRTNFPENQICPSSSHTHTHTHTHEPDISRVRYKMTQSTGTVGRTSTEKWKWGEKRG